MKHFIEFVLIGAMATSGISTTGHGAVPRVSPQVCKEVLGLFEKKFCGVGFTFECFCCDGLSRTELQEDIKTLRVLLDRFPSTLTGAIKELLHRRANTSAGLRSKVAPPFQSPEAVCRACFSRLLFDLKGWNFVRKIKETYRPSFFEGDLAFEEAVARRVSASSDPIRTKYKELSFTDISELLCSDVYAKCYEEALCQSSAKVRIYHRIFLFFDKEIPETDAALFYGEEVFRASLRYERVKHDIENGMINDKTYRLVGRFEQLAREILRRRNLMVTIAKAALKKDHFSRYHCNNRSNGKLPRELEDKIERETAFIDRMRARLTHMRNELNILQERLYRDSNWWKPANLIDEEEEKKILEEIE